MPYRSRKKSVCVFLQLNELNANLSNRNTRYLRFEINCARFYQYYVPALCCKPDVLR